MRFGCTIVNAYGLSECFVSIAHLKSELLGGAIPRGAIGKHLFGEVKVIDEAGNESPHRGRALAAKQNRSAVLHGARDERGAPSRWMVRHG